MAQTLQLHWRDDVVIATSALARGLTIKNGDSPFTLDRDIPAGHKIALRSRAVGDPIRRYGHVIGVASAPIRPGEHVHLHNLRASDMAADDVAPRARQAPTMPLSPTGPERFFDGYLRADGRVGTRNYVAIVSTVNCSASVCHFVRDRFRDVSRDYPHIDGVIALTHQGGCGHVAAGDDHRILERVLVGYARHPNVVAYIVIGLGCEVAQARPMVERHRLSLLSGESPSVIDIQEAGGTAKAVEMAVSAVERLLTVADSARRTRRSAADIVLGTNCGGSDGYSGITANPALGWAFDEIVRAGGTGVLAETTELFGAEHLLAHRAKDTSVARKLFDRIDWWRDHLRRHGVEATSNPSPGNLAGGITTLVEKSLGAVVKSGTTPLMDVIDYGVGIREKGFVYMDTPGYDPVSVTGLVAGGVNVVCFTTGRGSVFGCKPVPSIKLASNSAIYQRMNDDMDVDCGVIVEGQTIGQVGSRIFDEILLVASGKPTKSELAGVGEAEFAPWVRGPIL